MVSQNREIEHLLPAFYVDLVFFANVRKTVPVNSYRPHLVLQKDSGRNYLGVFFTGFSGTEDLGKPCLLQVNAMYEGIDYSNIVVGDLFWVMEGANIVAEGRVLAPVEFRYEGDTSW